MLRDRTAYVEYARRKQEQIARNREECAEYARRREEQMLSRRV